MWIAHDGVPVGSYGCHHQQRLHYRDNTNGINASARFKREYLVGDRKPDHGDESEDADEKIKAGQDDDESLSAGFSAPFRHYANRQKIPWYTQEK